MMPSNLRLLTIDVFSDKVGHIFVVDTAGVPAVELTLTKVTPLRNYANTTREPFSLIFTSPGRAVLPQRMYAIRHETMGREEIFMVPIAGDAEKVTYQSIFN